MFVGKDHMSLLLVGNSFSRWLVTCNCPENLVSLCERFCPKFVTSPFLLWRRYSLNKELKQVRTKHFNAENINNNIRVTNTFLFSSTGIRAEKVKAYWLGRLCKCLIAPSFQVWKVVLSEAAQIAICFILKGLSKKLVCLQLLSLNRMHISLVLRGVKKYSFWTSVYSSWRSCVNL